MMSLEDIISQKVAVQDVLEDWFGYERIPREGNTQISCPIGWEHQHGDMNKSCRVYVETNDCACFTLHGRMNAVRLVSLKDGVTPREAARRLARRYDLDLEVPDYLKLYARASHAKRTKPASHHGAMLVLTRWGNRHGIPYAIHEQYYDLAEEELKQLFFDATQQLETQTGNVKIRRNHPGEEAIEAWLAEWKERLEVLCSSRLRAHS